jgi:NADH dehydrogenase
MLGGRISKRLLADGRPVRVLVRHNSPSEVLAQQGMATTAQSLIDAGAQPVYADLKDPFSLVATLEGVDTVITTANSAMRSGEDNVENVDMKGNRSLIDAAKTAGVKHFIFTSAHIADADSPVPFVAAKGQTEQYLQASGLPYTITASNAFMEIWVAVIVAGPAMSGQPVTVVGSGERIHSFACIDDVASFTVAAVDNPAAQNARLVLGGPKALSFRDAAGIYSDLLGREVPIVSVAPGELIPGIPESVAPMAAGFDMYDSPMEMDELCETYGITLTPLETVAKHMVGAAAQVSA